MRNVMSKLIIEHHLSKYYKYKSFVCFYSSGVKRASLIAWLSFFACGCFGDEPFTFAGEDSDVPALPTDTSGDTAPQGPKELHAEDYIGFDQANDSYGPPGQPPQLDETTHLGWDMARCFDCHAEKGRFPPAGHDPRIQYWSWSCARGFPGGACHGHGINGAMLFNHERDENFAGCTKAECHDTYNTTKDRENHGMFDIPNDEYCHACHDFYWEGWPAAATK
jgi:hypothetical protein